MHEHDSRQSSQLDIVEAELDARLERIDAGFQKLQSEVNGLLIWKHRIARGLLAIGGFLALVVLRLIAEAIPKWIGVASL